MFPINKKERMNEKSAPKKIGKPIDQRINPKYIGCRIFE
jgi:hypothetical protein